MTSALALDAAPAAFIPLRWRIAAAAFVLQLSIGSVYAWSVFLLPVAEQFGTSRAGANGVFIVTMFAIGGAASVGGALYRKLGPRRLATIGGLVYGLGVSIAGLASELWQLYLGYGVLGGIGAGLCYIVPLAMLLPWFPERRGFITGFAVAGFGAGALVTGPLAAMMIAGNGVSRAFSILGLVFAVSSVASAQLFRPAPDSLAAATSIAKEERAGSPLTAALHRPVWYVLWAMLMLNISVGAAFLSVASPLAQDFTLATPMMGAFAVSLIAIANSAGRILWGWTSDRIGRPATFAALFALQAVALPSLLLASHFAVFLGLALIIGLCYGGGFATMPAFVADRFGARDAGPIYGAMLTAWSAGAVLGPLVIAALAPSLALFLLGGLMVLALPLPWLATRLADSAAVAAAR